MKRIAACSTAPCGVTCTFEGNYGGPKEGGLNIGQREGLNTESKAPSNHLLLTTPFPGDPLTSLQGNDPRCYLVIWGTGFQRHVVIIIVVFLLLLLLSSSSSSSSRY